MNWLFLRGLAREQRHWSTFPQSFAKHFTPDRVQCLDLPGFGTEGTVVSPQSVRGITDAVRERWLQSGRNQSAGDWAILGMSLGGMVSMDWVDRYPEDFRRIVLLNSSAANLSFPWERLNWKLIPTVFKAATQRDPQMRERAILMLTSALPRERLDELAREWAAFAAPSGAHQKKNAFRQLTAAVTFQAPDRLAVPGLVLSSLRDRFTSVKCSYALARHFGFYQAIHPSAGHDLSLDDPDWVMEQIRLFFKY